MIALKKPLLLRERAPGVEVGHTMNRTSVMIYIVDLMQTVKGLNVNSGSVGLTPSTCSQSIMLWPLGKSFFEGLRLDSH